jgi:hypothetical protein
VYACPLNITFVPARLDICGQVPVVVGNIVGVVPPPLPVWGVPPGVLPRLALVPPVLPPDDPVLPLALAPGVGVPPDDPLSFEVPSPEVLDDEVDSCPGPARPVTSVPHAIPEKGAAMRMKARRGMLTGWRMDSPPARKACES